MPQLPPMPPLSGPYPPGPGSAPTPETPQSARQQGSDLQIRQQQLINHCNDLAQQIQALGLTAPFVQDDLLSALSSLQEAKQKLIVQLGAEIEQASQGNSYPEQTEDPNAQAQQAQSGNLQGTANLY